AVKVARRARRQATREGVVCRDRDDPARPQLKPRLVAERHHVADRADHAELRVGSRRRRREGPAPRVTVEEPLLHEDVERLPDGRPADLEALAERVLGGEALALPAQILADRAGDLEVPWHPWTLVPR